MKHNKIILGIFLLAVFGILHQITIVSGATVCFPYQGCLGTSTVPTAGQIPIGFSNNTYGPVDLTAGANITITTSSGGITIAGSAASAGISTSTAPVADQITYWSSPSSIAGDANLTWNSSTQLLTITGSSTITGILSANLNRLTTGIGGTTLTLNASGTSQSFIGSSGDLFIESASGTVFRSNEAQGSGNVNAWVFQDLVGDGAGGNRDLGNYLSIIARAGNAANPYAARVLVSSDDSAVFVANRPAVNIGGCYGSAQLSLNNNTNCSGTPRYQIVESVTGVYAHSTDASRALQFTPGSTPVGTIKGVQFNADGSNVANDNSVSFIKNWADNSTSTTDVVRFIHANATFVNSSTRAMLSLTTGTTTTNDSTSQFRIYSDGSFVTTTTTRTSKIGGPLSINAGTSAQYAMVGGNLFSDTATKGNAAATETSIASSTIATSTLLRNGDAIRFASAGTFAATISTDKRIKVIISNPGQATTTIFDTGNIGVTTASDWDLEGFCVRTEENTQKCTTKLNTSFASLTSYADYSTAAVTSTQAILFDLSGGGTNANDTTKELWRVWYDPVR